MAQKERLSQCRMRHLAPPKHSRLAPAGRNTPCFVTRFCSLNHPPDALATLPLAPPTLKFESLLRQKRKSASRKGADFLGAEGETRTLAPVTRPTPLAGAPRHQLEYFCIGNTSVLFNCARRLAQRVGFEPTVRFRTTVFKTVPL